MENLALEAVRSFLGGNWQTIILIILQIAALFMLDGAENVECLVAPVLISTVIVTTYLILMALDAYRSYQSLRDSGYIEGDED